MSILLFLLSNAGNITAGVLALFKLVDAIKARDAQKVADLIAQTAKEQTTGSNLDRHKEVLATVLSQLPKEVSSIGGPEALSTAINRVYSTQVKPLEKLAKEAKQASLTAGEIIKLIKGN